MRVLNEGRARSGCRGCCVYRTFPPVALFKAAAPRCYSPGLNDFSDQAGPAGLMGSANSSTTLPVEILVKVNVIAKMWVALEPIVLAEDRASAFLIPRKESRQTAP